MCVWTSMIAILVISRTVLSFAPLVPCKMARREMRGTDLLEPRQPLHAEILFDRASRVEMASRRRGKCARHFSPDFPPLRSAGSKHVRNRGNQGTRIGVARVLEDPAPAARPHGP